MSTTGRKGAGNECPCPVLLSIGTDADSVVPSIGYSSGCPDDFRKLWRTIWTVVHEGSRYSLVAHYSPSSTFLYLSRGHVLFFQNVIGPKAQKELWTLLVSMKQKSPEVDIPEGVFYSDIEGYNIYVKKKTGIQVFCKMYLSIISLMDSKMPISSGLQKVNWNWLPTKNICICICTMVNSSRTWNRSRSFRAMYPTVEKHSRKNIPWLLLIPILKW